MSSETRKITVTGSASVFRVDGSDATSKTRRRKTNTASQSQSQSQNQAIVKIGGDAIQPTFGSGTIDTRVNTRADAGISGTTNAAINASANVKEITVVKPREEPSTSPVTGSSKVILGSKKPKHMKVILTKKNHEIAPAVTPSSKPNRKVSLGLTHLKRRVTRARRLNKLSKTAPIEQIKKELVTAHIIKTDSKAPEHILRQMYSDTKLLTSKSL